MASEHTCVSTNDLTSRRRLARPGCTPRGENLDGQASTHYSYLVRVAVLALVGGVFHGRGEAVAVAIGCEVEEVRRYFEGYEFAG